MTIYPALRLIRRHPRLAVLAGGLWIAALPWLLVVLIRQLPVWGFHPQSVDAFLIGLGSRTDLPFAIIIFSGLGLATAALVWMGTRFVIYTFRNYPI